ncbi:MAG: STAS domain-containing protein [Actinobacteria bacterium]|nr:STAS domain-containing protein [Actinomycetota bacterium]
MLFDVSIVRRGTWSHLVVVGDVDLATLPALRAGIDSADTRDVVVDLTSVGAIDPVALGPLLMVALRCTRRSGRFVVACPDGPARDLLGELRLDAVWELTDSAEAVFG